ncbi:hypothetical protein [uncultured Helicobacter sp.]|uniref:hypothetical protein n=1 Tax=uncultured Helicobacter sp. TaxID=175537 RepID=UPI00374F8588
MLAHLLLMGKALLGFFGVVNFVSCLDSVELDSEFESTQILSHKIPHKILRICDDF